MRKERKKAKKKQERKRQGRSREGRRTKRKKTKKEKKKQKRGKKSGILLVFFCACSFGCFGGWKLERFKERKANKQREGE